MVQKIIIILAVELLLTLFLSLPEEPRNFHEFNQNDIIIVLLRTSQFNGIRNEVKLKAQHVPYGFPVIVC